MIFMAKTVMNRPNSILIASDSFKGTMSSSAVSSIIEEALLELDPSLSIVSLPIADGGEGSVDAIFRAIGGEMVEMEVCGPNQQRVMASYLIKEDVAVIEAASACGLTLANASSSPMSTTAYGVGELIGDAIKRGIKRICLCVGGSSTNDMGAGIANALGAKFFDEEGKEFLPVGGTLHKVTHIDLTKMKELTASIQFEVLVDVNNPLYGPNGASRIFSPQKGASQEEVELLERGVIHLSDLIKAELGIDVSKLPGAGAAGGIGGGMVAFFDASLVSGVDTILRLCRFDELVQKADLVITGEGKLDSQSLHGKAISGVVAYCKRHGKEVVAVVGRNDLSEEDIVCFGLSRVIESGSGKTLEEIRKTCKNDLKAAVLQGFASYFGE